MIIILGNYIDYNIKSERGLPAYNPAGSNRMLRLSQSLESVGIDSLIISPAGSMRMSWTGKFFHKSKIVRDRGIKVLYCKALGVKYISMLFEQIIVFFTIVKISKIHRIEAMIVYCYYPSSVLAAFLSKYFLGIKIIEDLEDICEPKFTDWNSKTEANPVQQLFGSFLMNIMISISDTIVIPTSNFYNVLKAKKNVQVISGCIKVPDFKDNDTFDGTEGISVLFSGALEDENGVSLLIDFFKKADTNIKIYNKFIFEISGHGSKALMLREEVEKLTNMKVNFHGFLSDTEYSNILAKSQVALVLQDPNGRYSMLKTPSKGYEYISNGKMVIISKIGDFYELPKEVVLILEPYKADKLIEIFSSISDSQINAYKKNAHSYALNNWDSKIIGKKLQEMIFSK